MNEETFRCSQWLLIFQLPDFILQKVLGVA